MEPVVLERVREFVLPHLVDRGVELVELVLGRTGSRLVLRFLVDKRGGITLDEVSALNRLIGDGLESLDIVPEPYIIEVSSPGLDRPLKTPEDFRRARGERVRITTREAVGGRVDFVGEVGEVNEGEVTIFQREGSRFTVSFDKIAKAVRMIEI
ncbi:MAG: ribosome maturation factor RimP [Candidatus Omnitrophica bacterium]|nr:ribosome maturation factor RimP [Candidatus Omnitrophota bacterium]